MVVLLALAVVVIDIGHGYVRHLTLTSATERVALAGATGIDDSAEVKSAAPGTRLQLAQVAATTAARIQATKEAVAWSGLGIARMKVAVDSVEVKVCAPVRFPLAWRQLGASPRTICARAAAATVIPWSQYP